MLRNTKNNIREKRLPAPGLGMRDVLAGFFNRKWLIICTLVTSLVATAAFAFMAPEKYESRIRFLVKNVRLEAPVTTRNDNDVVADKTEVSEAEISSEIELLKSRDLLADVVKQTGLAQAAEPESAEMDSNVERAVYRLEKDLVFTPVKKANIIEVGYSSTSPKTAALVLNTLGQLYLDKRLKLHRPPGTSEFFKSQAERYQQDLRNKENNFTDFQQKKDAVDIDRQKELILTKVTESTAKLKDLDGKIAQDDKRIAALTTQLDGMQRRVVTQSRVLPNQYSVERLNTMLVELKNRRIQMLAKFQPEDRAVREVEDQIKETSEALQKATGSTAVEQSSDINPLLQPLETQLANAKVEQAGDVALRKNLSDQVLQYRARLTELAGATAIDNELSRQVKQAEGTYQLYSRKQEESQIEDALDEKKITNISVAETPIVPINPNRTNQTLIVVIGLMSGLLLSFGSAFLMEMLRETFISPRELQAFTGYPVVATLPLQKGRMARRAAASEVVAEPVADLPESTQDEFDDEFISDLSSDATEWEYPKM